MIDWYSQWQEHAHGFKDGFAHIALRDLAIASEATIVLAPGPGFGDLSHPTTHLALVMMAPFVANRRVLDLGSGSGILSLAAASLGAKSVQGVDIDDDAISHAKQNSAHNSLQHLTSFSKTAAPGAELLVMNMIRSEQKAAYESLLPAAKGFSHAITSGILKEEREQYLAQTASWGWQCQKIKQNRGWLGFLFVC